LEGFLILRNVVLKQAAQSPMTGVRLR
jgi:hypothetical protein